MLYILLLVGILIFFVVFYHRFIHIRCGNMILITGGIKTGKSMLSVSLAFHLLRSQKIKVFLYNTVGRFFIKLFHPKRKFEKKPKPVIYSNVPLRCDYIPLTTFCFIRKEVKKVPITYPAKKQIKPIRKYIISFSFQTQKYRTMAKMPVLHK